MNGILMGFSVDINGIPMLFVEWDILGMAQDRFFFSNDNQNIMGDIINFT